MSLKWSLWWNETIKIKFNAVKMSSKLRYLGYKQRLIVVSLRLKELVQMWKKKFTAYTDSYYNEQLQVEHNTGIAIMKVGW